MTNQELSVWYIENKRWLDAKARWFISNTTFDYGLHKELVSLTVEYLVYNLEDIDKTKLKEFSFYIMKRMFNMVIVNKRRLLYQCYGEDTDEYFINKVQEYDFERDEKEEKLVNIVLERAKTPVDLQVVNELMSGNIQFKQGKKLKTNLSSDTVQYSINRLKGIPPKKTKSRSKGIKDIYTGIAKILEGKIVKLYPNYEAIKKDGYSTSRVNQICKGRIKTNIYRKFEWKYVYN